MNLVCLIGRLTKDPELKTTQSGLSVTSFSIGVRRDKDNTDFIDVVAWRQTAENICKYFHKGDKIAITGRLQTRQYEDRNGNKRKAVEVVVNAFDFCNGKSNGETPKTSYSAPQSRNGTQITAEQFETLYNDENADDGLPF